jgi:hypothetical protein
VRPLWFGAVESGSEPEEIFVPSVLGRKEYVQLFRALQRRRIGFDGRLLGVALVVVLGVALLDRAWHPSEYVVIGLPVLAAAFWYAPTWEWSKQKATLAAPGTLTFGADGMHREIPGQVDVRFPWSRLRLMVDTGRFLVLRTGRYDYVMVRMPDEAGAAARLRDLIGRHLPARKAGSRR